MGHSQNHAVTHSIMPGLTMAHQAQPALIAALLQAISKAIAVINSITVASTSFEEVQKSTQVVLTTLSTEVQQLVTSGDVAAFEVKTSEASLREAVNTAKLEGTVIVPTPEDDGGSNKVGGGVWL